MFLEKAFNGKNEWPLYLFTLLIVFVAIQIAGIPLAIYLMLRNPEALQGGGLGMVTDTNTGLALTLLTFVAGFFVLFLCIKYIHRKNYLDIVTGRTKFCWSRFFFGAAVWGILSVITIAITIAGSEKGNIIFQFDLFKFLGLLAVSLLLLPFQTAFEEIMFRGYLMQGFTLLFKSKWTAFVLVAVLFGLMHSSNPEVKSFGAEIALPQYITMGLLLGFVALKDDGLELAIGLHAANNILAAVTFTSDASALRTYALFKDLSPTATHLDTLIMIICGVVFIAICNRKYRFLNDSIRPNEIK